jgi:hypothetical protein
MATYKKDAHIDQPAETPQPHPAKQQPSSVRESQIAIPIGTDKLSNDILYWSPTPDSGTLNPRRTSAHQ